MPDMSISSRRCETGCCHYALGIIASNCTPSGEPAPGSAAWNPPAVCEGQLPTVPQLCGSVKYQEFSETTIAFNDRKMNECPGRMVHTLTLPRRQVCGEEDPDRRSAAADIFETAWRIGVRLIARPDDAALVLNSRAQRSQNQLHVHTVKLKPGARAEIEALAVKPKPIEDLRETWDAAERHASESGFGDVYGTIVIQYPGRGWLVATVDGSPRKDPQTGDDLNSPERRFTCWSCSVCSD